MKNQQPHRALNTGKIRSAVYDENRQTLEIAFHEGLLRSYRNLPPEVAQRFFAAPNPAIFWEDRIAEEYPMTQTRISTPPPVMGDPATAALEKLNALFQRPGDR